MLAGRSCSHTTNYGGAMCDYRERLRAPALWWVLGFITTASMATLFWGGFSLAIGIISYVVLIGGPGLALLVWGERAIVVRDGMLAVGRVVLPLSRVGQVQALDEAQTRELAGPQADPTAVLMVRSFLRRAVYVEVIGEGPVPGRSAWAGAGPPPYWLVGTRHPEELAAAISGAVATARTSDPTVA
jgi:hypothetical protein